MPSTSLDTLPSYKEQIMSVSSFNLARRLSATNEPDLLQEDMTTDSDNSPTSSPLTQKACFAMLDKFHPNHPFVTECEQFNEIKTALQRVNSDRSNHAIAFQGMLPSQATAAMASREKGHLNHAQIQRRMTNNSKRLW